MSDQLPPCPKCGVIAGIYRNVRLWGWGEEHFGTDGEQVELLIGEGLQVSNTKTVRCEECSEIRRDVVVRQGRVMAKEASDE